MELLVLVAKLQTDREVKVHAYVSFSISNC